MERTDLDAIRAVESKTIDAKKYRGLKVRIADVRIEEVTDWYNGPEDDDGKPTYNPTSTSTKKVVIVETAALPELDSAENPTSTITDITVKRRFNLKKEVGQNGVEWVISKAPKAELWAFMRNMSVQRLSELIGQTVMLTAEADKADASKFWLRIAD